MIRLISNSALSGQLLQAVLAGAVSANQPEATVSYFDMPPQSTASVDSQHGTTYQVALNSATDVTIVSPPGAQQTGTAGQAGYVRMIDYIDIYNKDTASIVLTVKIDDATVEKILWKGTLLTLEAVYYEHGQGWYAVDANGNVKTTGGLGVASQADQEAGTSIALIVTPGRQQYHQSAAKGWVNFTSVTNTVNNASYNVSSLTDDGVGITTINWNVDFSGNFYAVSFSFGNAASNIGSNMKVAAMTAAALQVTKYENAVETDCANQCVTAFGDQ